MAKEPTLQEVFLDDIRDLFDAEKQLVKALPKMAKAAGDEELVSALREHLEVTKGQVQRLEQVFAILETRATGKPCKGMKGIVEEGAEILEEDYPEALMDAAITAAGRKVEHYEMVGYESARGIARQLGMKDAADLLEASLREEIEADRTLSQISKRLVKGAPRGTAAASQNQQGKTGKAATRSGKSSAARSAGASNSAGASATTDHDEIRRWAEERGAHPACVKGTGNKGDTGMIRLDFPGYTGADSLQAISWDDWFRKFDENDLALLYQEKTSGGKKSNFNKLVSRQTAQEAGAKSGAKAAR